jgi:hypothetical protein
MFGGSPLWNGAAFTFAHMSNNVPLGSFNQDPGTPDIVERWAPVIWHDVNMGNYSGREDIITKVNFDGDFKGSNNAFNMVTTAMSMPANVYWSLVEGSTHSYIGYYFYHANSRGRAGTTHEHDVEGVVIAVNRTTGEVDAMLSNAHGNYIPYRSPFDTNPFMATHPRPGQYGDESTFTHFTTTSPTGFLYDTIAVGVEAGTHATWGRWHNRCIVGPVGSTSGCDTSHGGDGVVLEYRNTAVSMIPSSVKNWPDWGKTTNRLGYDLLPIRDLFTLANNPSYAGQNEPTALYRVDAHGVPWDMFNAGGDDAGDLPWAWGLTQVIGHACTERNMLLQPGWIFRHYFLWPSGVHDGCGTDANNSYQQQISVCEPPPACPNPMPPIPW